MNTNLATIPEALTYVIGWIMMVIGVAVGIWAFIGNMALMIVSVPIFVVGMIMTIAVELRVKGRESAYGYSR